MSGRHTRTSSIPRLVGPKRTVFVVAGLTAAMFGVGLPASQASASPTFTPTSGGCVRPGNGGSVTCTFAFTGASETWSAPSGVTSVVWRLVGAQGGSTSQYRGGLGAQVAGTREVTAGEEFTVDVGRTGSPNMTGGVRPGGYGGGGDSGGGGSAGGGGASTVSDGDGRLLVAGGGGGASDWYPGGDAGAKDGSAGGGNTGEADTAGVGGGGATTTQAGGGGAGGNKNNCSATGTLNGGPGSGGSGANGGDGGIGGAGASGGGGGGGWFGGGGGGSAALCTGLGTGGAGGGGGSSNVRDGAGLTNVSYAVGGSVGTGNGSVSVTFDLADDDGPPSVTVDQADGQSDPAADSPILFSAVFSQPVTGFSAADVDFSGSTAGGTLAASVTEVAPKDGTSFEISVTGMTDAGDVVASIPAGKVADAQFSTNTASTSTDNLVQWQPDTAGPTASPSQSPAANGNGWNNTDVTVDWNWTDPSGIDLDHCDTSSVATLEGSYDVTGACKDGLGNASSAKVGVKIDKTKPQLSPTVVPNPVILGGALPTVSPGATDTGGSGVATASCGTPSTAAIGTFAVTCSATDNAGNTATAQVSYTVAAFFGQWHSPMPKSTVKAGSTIPVKFTLRNGSGAITGAVAKALVSGKQLRVLLTDKDGITVAETICCTWVSSSAYFQCNLKTPKKLTKNPYQLSVQERRAGSQSAADFFTAPGGTTTNPNPETIYFK